MNTYDDETHSYRIEGRKVPSVTQLLKLVSPDFDFVPKEALEAAQARGKDIHARFEAYVKEGALKEGDQETAQFSAWYKEQMLAGWRLVSCEQPYYSTRGSIIDFAGTPDLVLDRYEDTIRRVNIVDFKTGEMHKYFELQLALYADLVEQNVRAENISNYDFTIISVSKSKTKKLTVTKAKSEWPAIEAARGLLCLYAWMGEEAAAKIMFNRAKKKNIFDSSELT
jgi:hypothetical protein